MRDFPAGNLSACGLKCPALAIMFADLANAKKAPPEEDKHFGGLTWLESILMHPTH